VDDKNNNIDLSGYTQIHWLPNASNEIISLFEKIRRHESVSFNEELLLDASFKNTTLALAFAIGEPSQDETGFNPRLKSLSCATSMLLNNVDLNLRDAYQFCPLNYAAWFGKVVNFDILLKSGADPNPEGSPSIMDSIFASRSHKVIDNETFLSLIRIAILSGVNVKSGSKRSISSPGLPWLVVSVLNDWYQAARIFIDDEINDASFNELSMSANEQQLCWLETNGVDILSRLPIGHEHAEAVYNTNAEKTKLLLLDMVGLNEDSDDKSSCRYLCAFG